MTVLSKPEPPLGKDLKGMVSHFVRVVLAYKPGKVLISIWGLLLVITAYAGIRKQFKKRTYKKEVTSVRKEKIKREGLLSQLKRIAKYAIPSIVSKPALHLGLYSFFLCLRIILTIKIANITGTLGKTVGAKSFDQMFRLQTIFALWCLPAALTNSFLNFERSKLALSLRTNLVKHIHSEYLDEFLVYYRVGNLSQTKIDFGNRATQDIKKFCKEASELYGNLLKPVLEIYFISRALSKMIGFKQLLAFFAYFFFAGQLLRFIMPPFSRYTAEIQNKEGKLRANHHRIATCAEEIAFYGGHFREKELTNRSYDAIRKTCNKVYFLRLLMNMIDSYIVKYGASMVAYSAMLPAIYLGLYGKKNLSSPQIIEYYLTATQLFVGLGSAMKNIILSYKRIQDLTGFSVRVTELLDMVEDMSGGFEGKVDIDLMIKKANENKDKTCEKGIIKEGETILFEHVDLFSPTGVLLVKDLNFAVEKNVNVLIAGPNGSGKSSLFRLLGGLWPITSGTLTKPKNSQLFYIPQKPYLGVGTLCDQITYPLSYNALTEEQEEKLYELMDLVNLSYIIDREGGLFAVKDWMDVLSGGEKQRVAMARLFYHKPKYGILDECTSAVSIDVESKLYETCKNLGITIFTVSHRQVLRHHHDFELKFDGEGGWKFSKIKEDGTVETINENVYSNKGNESQKNNQNEIVIE